MAASSHWKKVCRVSSFDEYRSSAKAIAKRINGTTTTCIEPDRRVLVKWYSNDWEFAGARVLVMVSERRLTSLRSYTIV